MISISLSRLLSSLVVLALFPFAVMDMFEDEKAINDSELSVSITGLTAKLTSYGGAPERSLIGFYALLFFAGALI